MGLRPALRWHRKEIGLIRGPADRDLIQGIPAVTICFFVLGPLPQAVKLFAMKGLPWTKAWAVCLFAGWMGEIIVRFLAGIPGGRVDLTMGEASVTTARILFLISRITYQLAFLAQVAMWIWILVYISASEGVRKSFGEYAIVSIWLIILLGFIGLSMGAYLGVVGYLVSIFSSKIVRIAIGIIFYVGFFPGVAAWSEGLSKLSFFRLDRWFKQGKAVGSPVAVVVIPICIACLVWICTVLLILFDHSLARLARGRNRASHEDQAQLLPMLAGSLDQERGFQTESLANDANTPASMQSIWEQQRLDSTSRSLPFPHELPHNENTNAHPASAANDSLTPPAAGSTTIHWQRLLSLSNLINRRFSPMAAIFTSPLEFLGQARREDSGRRVLAIAFALVNLLMALLYYSIRYSSAGTRKPSWTEMLG